MQLLKKNACIGRALMALCTLFVSLSLQAATAWSDVTATYLSNPSFDSGSITGWTITGVTTNARGYQGASYSNGDVNISQFVETWRNGAGLGTGYIYTRVTLPAGTYRLSADCIATNQTYGKDYVSGVSLYYSTDNNTFTETEMATDNGAPEHFNVVFTNNRQQQVYLGIHYNNATANWVAMDNVTLELQQTVTAATSLTLNATSRTMQADETFQLSCTARPLQAVTSLKYSTSNADVATVSSTGLITAHDTGTAIITVTDEVSGLSQQCTVMVQNPWMDVTSMVIVNPNFDGSVQGWEVANDNVQNWGLDPNGAIYQNGTSTLHHFLEEWIPNGTSLGNGYIRQEMELQPGRYKLGADVIAVRQGRTITHTGAYLYALVDGEYWQTTVSTQDGKPEYFANEFEVTEPCVVQFGVRTENTNINWLAMDNFHLFIYIDDYVPAGDILDCPATLRLPWGSTYQFNFQRNPNNATFWFFDFSSNNSSVASVDNDGLMTIAGEGTATITITDRFTGRETYCVVETYTPELNAAAYQINEIQVCNIDQTLDPSTNYGSWVEIYNPTDEAAMLWGLYVTDDPANLKQHKLRPEVGSIMPRGYKNIWFDHYGIWKRGELSQVDDKLSYGGGTFYLTDGTKIIAQQEYPQGIGRCSYARKNDGTWAWSSTPTPEASNAGMAFATEQLAAPVVDRAGGLIEDGERFWLNVEIPAGATLRYTTDGSPPTLTNGSISADGRFYISGSCVYRFRLFQNGFLPSEVVTRSYINDYWAMYENSNIISLAIDPADWDGSDHGLFGQGPNGRPGNGQNGDCNWNMAWDRTANFEYITENQEVVNQEVDMSACGGWSRAWTPHSFKLKGNKYNLGQNTIDYQFFEEKPYVKYKSLQIRNGGNNSGSGRIKDAAIQEIIQRSGLYVDHQAWNPVRVYINGNFYAYLNMRETNNKHNAYTNYGLDSEEIDQFEISPDSGYVQMEGTFESMQRLLDYAALSGTSDAAYEEVKKLLDIDEFVNYMAVMVYLRGGDWMRNNVKGYRDRNNGKFHFVVFDTDGAFASKTYWDYYYMKPGMGHLSDELRGEDALGHSYWQTRNEMKLWPLQLFYDLLENADFRKRYVDATCVVGGSIFRPEFVEEVLLSMDDKRPYASIYNSSDGYEIRNYFTAYRQQSRAQELASSENNQFFGMSGQTPHYVTLDTDGTAGAQLWINQMPVPRNTFEGYLYAPTTIKAIAPAGYKFDGWSTENSSVQEVTHHSTPFSYNELWTYDDRAVSLDGENWQEQSLTSIGYAPIGYDTRNASDIATEVSNWPLKTYYLTKTFNIDEDVNEIDEFTLKMHYDDGVNIWVNGEFAGRLNMYVGDEGWDAIAIGASQGNYGYTLGQLALPADVFHKGENIIAIELHNNNATSGDICWDGELLHTWTTVEETSEYASTNTEFTIPATGTQTYVAVFSPMSADEKAEKACTPVKVNEVSASNDIYVNDYFKRDDWFELFNTTDDDIDLAGMYLSDNEENPQKFQVPTQDGLNTIIPAHGSLVVWASKRDIIGEQLHTNFKLSNADGARVVITSEDGTWRDRLVYKTHGAKETVGLYPDGASSVYSMSLPTIGKTNAMTSYNQFLYENKPMEAPTEFFELQLSEGWNWVSHPVGHPILTSQINAYASRIMGQNAETVKDGGQWYGDIAALQPAVGYKVLMNQDAEYTFEAPFLSNDHIIGLRKGWNWIGYPQTKTQNLKQALSSFLPTEGDIIVGQDGFVTYEDGEWSGSLEAFEPGSGYLYKSGAVKGLNFSVEANRLPWARKFHLQPRNAWTANPTHYPNVMGLVARLLVGDEEPEAGTFSVGAFDADDNCRGVGRYIDGTIFMNIYGDGGESIVFRAMDAETSVVYDIAENYCFASGVSGSRNNPVLLHVGEATGIVNTQSNAAFAHSAYYTLDGRYAGNEKNTLRSGVYVVKHTMQDGTVISNKTIVK